MGRPRIHDEFDEIQEMRRLIGLKPLRRGDRRCHRCGEVFFSENLETVWHCPACRLVMTKAFAPDGSKHYGKLDTMKAMG